MGWKYYKISKLASKLSTKLFWKFLRPFWPSGNNNQEKDQNHQHKMGTVLSFSPKNNHYDENNGTVPSVKEEKSMKKHGIFLNGLSWKSFGHKNSAINHQTNNQYPTQQAFKGNKL